MRSKHQSTIRKVKPDNRPNYSVEMNGPNEGKSASLKVQQQMEAECCYSILIRAKAKFGSDKEGEKCLGSSGKVNIGHTNRCGSPKLSS